VLTSILLKRTWNAKGFVASRKPINIVSDPRRRGTWLMVVLRSKASAHHMLFIASIS
jgi:hypothetical protein